VISQQGILYIEPVRAASAEPVIDELTQKMTAALRQSKAGVNFNGRFLVDTWRGSHACSCGSQSTSNDYQLPGGEMTNGLAVHYLAWHRREISDEQIAKVAQLEVEPAEPTIEELCPPGGNAYMARFPCAFE
jgi:hypothetical protein